MKHVVTIEKVAIPNMMVMIVAGIIFGVSLLAKLVETNDKIVPFEFTKLMGISLALFVWSCYNLTIAVAGSEEVFKRYNFEKLDYLQEIDERIKIGE